jgi:hypothetical protein
MSTENSSGKMSQECPDFGQGEVRKNNVGLPFPSHSKLSKTGGGPQQETENLIRALIGASRFPLHQSRLPKWIGQPRGPDAENSQKTITRNVMRNSASHSGSLVCHIS